ncbi:MAG: diheme cytochrome c-553 [Bacteroidia bacterium]|nr:diheme cytochrome c-553 [Bacteroidia bacterium]
MNSKYLYVAGALAMMLWALTFSSCKETQHSQTTEVVKTEIDQEAIIKRGEYLVTIMGCNDCHSPKRMGPNGPEIIPELMLSGYPADREIVQFQDELIGQGFALLNPDLTAGIGPWGTSFAGNLTPHETGIGNWTEEQFKKALMEGKYKGMDGGRMLLPPMPWVNYKDMTDEDLKAVFGYLKSIAPVNNIVPPPIPPQ